MKRGFRASFNGYHVDSEIGLLHENSGNARLQAKELAVLMVLVRNAGKLVSKDELIKTVWGEVLVSDSSIARCISSIKSLLRKTSPGTETLIKTIYGKGYCFVGEVQSKADSLREESFNALLDAIPDVVMFKDGDGRWLVLNQAGYKGFDLIGVDWYGKTDLELAATRPAHIRDAIEECAATDEVAWSAREPFKSFLAVPSAGGAERYFEVTKSPLFFADGSRDLLIVIGHDVTDLLSLLEKQKLSDEVLANSHDVVLITDAQNKIVQVNRAFTSVTGYGEDEVVGKNPSLLSSGRHDQEFYQSMWQQIEQQGKWSGEIWNRRKSGEIYSKWMNISTVRDTEGALMNYIAIFSAIGEHKVIQSRIEHFAYHDPLTKLPNRLLLRDRFDQAVAGADREGTMLGVLFLDMDRFKQVNDSAGHEAGDRLLCLAAERMENVIRETDTVSRVGGDEFVVLLTEVRDGNMVAVVAEKMLEAMVQPYDLGSIRAEVSVSIGIAIYPNDGKDFDTLLKMADTSMYHAKNCGRNTYRFFTEKMNQESAHRIQMQDALRNALINAEFELYYQPQFTLQDRKLNGMEALLRWNSPTEGLMLPDQFLPIAEEDSSLMLSINEWVLQEACRQNRLWQKSFGKFRVAVNLSVQQFGKFNNITDTVAAVLSKSKLDPQYLELELDESILMQEVDHMSEVIHKLKALGVTLSIDDFGTGFSCLSCMKNLPVDSLKIDSSFVYNMCNDSADLALVRSIIQLAHNLGCSVIAEGVETQEQLQMLQAEGCDEAQGFLWGQPMTKREATQFLRTNATSQAYDALPD